MVSSCWSRTSETSGLDEFGRPLWGLGFFGGCGSYCLRVINVSEQRLVEGSLKTAFKNIFSLEILEANERQVLLSVGGSSPLYSNCSSDIYRVEALPEESRSDYEGSEHEGVTQKKISTTHSSEDMMLTLLSRVLAYVETLFREFTKQSNRNKNQGKGRFGVSTVTEVRNEDRVCEYELTNKLQRIIQDFEFQAQGKEKVVYSVPYY